MDTGLFKKRIVTKLMSELSRSLAIYNSTSDAYYSEGPEE